MKYLIALLFCLNAEAYTLQQYKTKIRALDPAASSFEQARLKPYAIKCGTTYRNKKLFVKQMIQQDNEILMDCMTSKITEVTNERTARAAMVTEKAQAKENMRSADCTQLTGTLKDMCWLLK